MCFYEVRCEMELKILLRWIVFFYLPLHFLPIMVRLTASLWNLCYMYICIEKKKSSAKRVLYPHAMHCQFSQTFHQLFHMANSFSLWLVIKNQKLFMYIHIFVFDLTNIYVFTEAQHIPSLCFLLTQIPQWKSPSLDLFIIATVLKDNNYEQTKDIKILTSARLDVDKAAVWADTCKVQLCQLFFALY